MFNILSILYLYVYIYLMVFYLMCHMCMSESKVVYLMK